MKTIDINLGIKSYKIEIDKNLLNRIGKKIKENFSYNKIFVITDENVASFYLERLVKVLEKENFLVSYFIIPPGEKSKNLNMASEIYKKLVDKKITRGDLIITLGGGVVGDLGGFVAATFLRGIDFIQVPTSLLAQIDSSIGGKVAVDLEEGKNLVGSFYQPKAVYIDTELLKTLPIKYFRDGLGEAIKCSCIRDKNLFSLFENMKDEKEVLEKSQNIIEACCMVKKKVVENDEFDRGERMILNFGHTIGHAIEKNYNFETFTHGEAVSIGMCKITKIMEELGITQKGTFEKIKKVLEKFSLPTDCEINREKTLDTIGRDKKNFGKSINLIVLSEIGNGKIMKIDFKDIEKYI
ncbi:MULTISPECIES: 3-dehydroquinate synthase [Fusobacterium]|uniref:3-dehydroquinate synthase n=1 Tax=Fusobacterium TaxID=848 RepID=UPI0014771106|nr:MULTISPECIES: 3-dehydroquinate synthase [Fusobacterium]NME34990.1 3-dehydroquinate synthase [Fusobacterium sp. FSA-380-WT-3A]